MALADHHMNKLTSLHPNFDSAGLSILLNYFNLWSNTNITHSFFPI